MLDVSSEGFEEDQEHIANAIEKITSRIGIPISISTSNPDIMSSAIDAGASLINDIRALTMPGALAKAVELRAPVCLMHMQNDPVTKQVASVDGEIVKDVYQYLELRRAACLEAGIDHNKIVIDPRFGFGKTLPNNIALLRSLNKFKALNCPIMVGLSHKSMIGQIIDEPVEQRVFGSITAAAIAIGNGADIIRAHEVKATTDAIKVIRAVMSM